MRVVLSRFIAILLLVIPGLAATYGFLAIKDVVFVYFSDFGNDEFMPRFGWGKFILGIILFMGGVGFIGGWIFFRDRKHNYLSPRFRKKKSRPQA
ncbi:DUF2627 domain-containing protein [Paenibacillus tarimensis]